MYLLEKRDYRRGIKKYKYDDKRIEIIDAREVIEMTDDPVTAVKVKRIHL